MDIEERLVDTLKLDVEENTNYEFLVTAWHYGEYAPKGMVLFVRLFNSKGKEIPSKLFQFSASRAFTNYKYIATGTKSDPVKRRISVQTPKDIDSIEIGLAKWGFLDSPEGIISLHEESGVNEVDLEKSSLNLIRPIDNLWVYSIGMNIINPKEIVGRIAILTVKYFDVKHRELTPSAKEHLAWSSKFDAHYRYISSTSGEPSLFFEHIMYPPEETSIVELNIHNWNDGNCKLLVEGPSQYSLNWKHSDRKGLLAEAGSLGEQSARSFNKRAEVAAVNSKEKQMELNYQSFIHTGDLYSAFDSAKELYQMESSKKNLYRLRHIESLIESLDLDWFPKIMSSSNLSGDIVENRILHLFKVSYPFESTGGSIRNLNIVKCQLNQGLEPIVVTPLNYPRIFNVNNFKLEEIVEGVQHIRLDFGSNASEQLSFVTRNLQANCLMLAGIIRKYRPSIIHAASGYKGYELAVMADALSRHFSIPWVYEVRSFHEHTWTNDHFQAETSIHTSMRLERENSLMKRANHVVTISESMKDAIIDRGINSDSITVVHNAVDSSEFKPRKKNSKLVNKLGIKKDKIIGYISNMSYREGHDILIRGFQLIKDEMPDAKLLLVGDGRDREKLEKLVSELQLNDSVIFTGNVDHSKIKDYYGVIDLFVVPRRHDYAADLVTPLKPYEAMGLGRPLLVSDRPALKEIVGEDRGFVFKTEDYADLARVAIGCFNSPEECLKATKNARKWLLDERNWEHNAQIYTDLYRKLTNSNTQ